MFSEATNTCVNVPAQSPYITCRKFLDASRYSPWICTRLSIWKTSYLKINNYKSMICKIAITTRDDVLRVLFCTVLALVCLMRLEWNHVLYYASYATKLTLVGWVWKFTIIKTVIILNENKNTPKCFESLTAKNPLLGINVNTRKRGLAQNVKSYYIV